MTADVFYEVLGPVAVHKNGLPLRIGTPKQQAVLAALLLSEGGRITTTRLVEAVWGDTPSPSAHTMIRTYVYRLRQAFRAHMSDVIRSVGSGYSLVVPAENVDLFAARRAAAKAREAWARGEAEQADKLLTKALDGWRGTPLFGVPGPFAAAQRRRMIELRLALAKERIGWRLATGRYTDAVAELSVLSDEHPLDESLCALVMIALYGDGRKAEALNGFLHMRQILRQELGIEPSPELHRVQQLVLESQVTAPQMLAETAAASGAAAPPPVLTAPEPVRPARAARASVETTDPERAARSGGMPPPAQLPPGLTGFVGRREELRQLDLLLERGACPQNTAVVTVNGAAGVGKSALAVHWARQVRDRFPDGQLYTDMRFAEPGSKGSPCDVMAGFLNALGVPPESVPAGIDARAALFRSLLAGRQILVLLDNAPDAKLLRQFLPGTEGCFTLITSRSRLHGLVATHQAASVHLDVFGHCDARELLSQGLGHARAESEPDAVAEIIEQCGRLPLALSVILARAAEDPDLPVSGLADQLRHAEGTLDAFTTADDPVSDMRIVLSWSYERLSPEAALLFRRLALLPGLVVTAQAAACLAQGSARHAEGLLEEISSLQLLARQAPDEFRAHRLVRAFAAELMSRENAADQAATPLRPAARVRPA